jgi:hypothetical protein
MADTPPAAVEATPQQPDSAPAEASSVVADSQPPAPKRVGCCCL